MSSNLDPRVKNELRLERKIAALEFKVNLLIVVLVLLFLYVILNK